MNNDYKRREIYIDFLRVIACFLVLFNHKKGYHVYLSETYGVRIWFHLFISMFTRINVPIFFMISGYLLLKKTESIKDILKKRVFRIVAVLFVASLLLCMKNHLALDTNGIKDFIIAFCSNTVIGGDSYWYLYSYIAFLLMIPFLNPITKLLGDNEYRYLLVLHVFLCTVFPVIGCFVEGFYVSLPAVIPTTNLVFYPLMGYWLGTKNDLFFKKKICMVLCLVSIASIFIESILTIHFGESGAYTQDFVMLMDYAIAISVYYCTRYMISHTKIDNGIADVISLAGKATFGIYLIDPIVGSYMFKIFDFYLLGDLLGSFVYCIVAMVIFGGVTLVLCKVPVIKRFL